MTFTTNLTEADYRAFRNYVLFRLRKLHLFIGAIGVGLLLFSWFSNKPETPLSNKIAGVVGLLVVWLISMLVAFLAWKLLTRLTGGRFHGSVGQHSFEITEDTFIESNPQGRRETKLSGLRRVAETDSHFFVITHTGLAHVIPKRDLQNFDALHDLQKRVAVPNPEPPVAQ